MHFTQCCHSGAVQYNSKVTAFIGGINLGAFALQFPSSTFFVADLFKSSKDLLFHGLGAFLFCNLSDKASGLVDISCC